jgi:excisionase family DNA binding protein
MLSSSRISVNTIDKEPHVDAVQAEARAFAELAAAFERFRQAHKDAVAAQQQRLQEQQEPQVKRTTISKQPEQPLLMTHAQAAEYLGVTPGTLATWHCVGRYSLPVVKVGRSVRYRRADLERWLINRTKP